MRKLLILFFISFLTVELAAQQITYDNYLGNWQNAGSWQIGPPTMPYNVDGTVTIQGNITSTTGLEFDKGELIISDNDTLKIQGDLILGNNALLTIEDGGILIIYGSMLVANKVEIAAGGYLVVMGNLNFAGSGNKGSFTSSQDPAQVYVGGIVTPPNNVDYDNFPILECGTGDHEHSGCNYGDPIDLQDSPIADLVNENCTDIPVITAISSNSPILVGNTIILSTTANPGTGSWPMEYYWEGPAGFSSTLEDPTRAAATTAMTGYYLLIAFNTEGCTTTDSVYVEVTSNTCCSGYSYVSKDNYTGNWEDETSWATPNEPWRPLPPPTNPMNTQTICINGRITVNGDLTINGGNQRICDTLIITGNLNVQSYGMTISPTGVLIVLGNFTGSSGSMDVDGRVVVVGDITSPNSNSVSNDGAFYVFDDTPAIVGFTPTGDETTLENNDPSLFDLIVNLTCGPAISGGTIADSQTRCEGTDVEAFTSVADASPGIFTYQWYYSTTSNDPATGTWSAISGATSTTFDEGSITSTTNYYRRAIKTASCTKLSNVLTITVYPVPVTGPQYHIHNQWND